MRLKVITRPYLQIIGIQLQYVLNEIQVLQSQLYLHKKPANWGTEEDPEERLLNNPYFFCLSGDFLQREMRKGEDMKG